MRNGSDTGRRGGTGRRAGLKIQYSRECVGSNPSAGKMTRKPPWLPKREDCSRPWGREQALLSYNVAVPVLLHFVHFVSANLTRLARCDGFG
jgi:hypothetical protein